jgi:hypothetical protein
VAAAAVALPRRRTPRSHLAEFGIIAAKGRAHLADLFETFGCVDCGQDAGYYIDSEMLWGEDWPGAA